MRDAIDMEMFLVIIFSWGSAVSLGLVGSDIIPFIDAGQPILEFGNATLTLGRIAAIAALGVVLFNRDAGFSDTKGVDVWIVYATIGLVIAPPLFPALAGTLAETPAAIIAFSVQTTGFMLVSYLN